VGPPCAVQPPTSTLRCPVRAHRPTPGTEAPWRPSESRGSAKPRRTSRRRCAGWTAQLPAQHCRLARRPDGSPTAPDGGVAVLRCEVKDRVGRPLEGVLIAALDGALAGTTTLTNTSGRFELTGAPAASVTVRVSRDGFRTRTQTLAWDTPASVQRSPVPVWLETVEPPIGLESGDYTLPRRGRPRGSCLDLYTPQVDALLAEGVWKCGGDLPRAAGAGLHGPDLDSAGLPPAEASAAPQPGDGALRDPARATTARRLGPDRDRDRRCGDHGALRRAHAGVLAPLPLLGHRSRGRRAHL